MGHMRNIFDHITQWYAQPPGQYFLAEQMTQLSACLNRYYGETFVQIGGPLVVKEIELRHFDHHYYVWPELIKTTVTQTLLTDLDRLPLQSNSVDVILLYHALALIAEPQALIREAYRTLLPGGQLIVIDFNPYSLWGIQHKLHQETHEETYTPLKSSQQSQQPQWSQQPQTLFPARLAFPSKHHMKRWLHQAKFSLVSCQTYHFRPGMPDTAWYRRLLPLEAIGQFALPGLGGVIMMVAEKRQLEPETVRQRWRRRYWQWRRSSCAKPTTRQPYS